MSVKFNPQITTVEVGVRELTEHTIYPLSMHDQFEATELIKGAADAFFTVADEEEAQNNADKNKDKGASTDLAFISKVVDIIRNNLEALLKLVTADDDEIFMEDLTNDQFADLAEILYKVNYEGSLGNLKSLFSQVKNTFRLKRPSQNSSLEQVTEQNISLDSATLAEE